MKRSSRNTLLTSAAAGLILCVMLARTGLLDHATARGSTNAAALHGHVPAASSPGPLWSDSDRPEASSQEVGWGDDAEIANEKPKTTLERWRGQVFEQHPDIAEFARLDSKVLKSTDDLSSFRRMLSDRQMILAARDDLLADGPVLSEVEQRKRMYRVEYLGAALRWKDNPERAMAIEAVSDAIFARNLDPESSPEMRKSLAGDKIELFWALMEHEPSEAEDVQYRSKGTEFERLINYARRRWDAVMSPPTDDGG